MAVAADSIGAASFAAAMTAFAPFEPGPLIAVGVSGGPDSMALILLLDSWARGQGGAVLGLTVDHGLRPESASEARQVGDWLAARGIAHAVLRWHGEKPAAGIQQAARDARYELLAAACAERGILHLAVAHHADDQAETLLFRRERSSGEDGLAGMSAARSLGPVRLIRPLLAWPKSALVATCAAFGQPFLDDPSNSAPLYARTGLRRRLAGNSDERDMLLDAAAASGVARVGRERLLAGLLGRIAEARPDGAILLDLDELMDVGPDLRRAALAAALRTAGGGAYAPETGAVERLESRLTADGFSGASLAGCAVRPWRGRLLICREPGRIGVPVPLPPGAWVRWDGRFLLRAPAGSAALEVGPLGRAVYAGLRRRVNATLPSIVAAGLPAITAEGRLLAVPGLGWSEPDAPAVAQRLAPGWPLAPETFTVVNTDRGIICVRVGRSRRRHVDPGLRAQSRHGS